MLIVSLLHVCSATVSVAGVLDRYIVISFEGKAGVKLLFVTRVGSHITTRSIIAREYAFRSMKTATKSRHVPQYRR